MPKYAELPAFREQNFITEADGDMLHREACAFAIRRIEESVRTEEDFKEVIRWWDKLGTNRERTIGVASSCKLQSIQNEKLICFF